MKKLLLIMATLGAAISCNNDELANDGLIQENESAKITTTISVAREAISRVAFTTNGDLYDIKWKPNDTLGVWSKSEGGSRRKTLSTFTIFNFDADNSTFKGEVLDPKYTKFVRFVHPYHDINDKGYSGYTLDLSQQTFSKDLSHLNNTTPMVSNMVPFDGDGSNSVLLEEPQMIHIGALMKVRVKVDESIANSTDYKLTKVVVKSVPTKATINLEQTDITKIATIQEIGDITIDATEVEAEGGIFTLPVNILPKIYKADSTQIVETYFTKDGEDYKAITSIEIAEDVEFPRATVNKLNVLVKDIVSLTEYSITTTMISGKDFPININNDTFVSDLYEIVSCGKYTDNASYFKMKRNVGYFYNKVPYKGLTTIKINFDNENSSVLVYAGSAINPTDKIESVDGIYNIPANCEYFKIKANGKEAPIIRSVELFCKVKL